ncbi:MAG: TadE/TadG family type IV pilus assembly protein [Planctomycetota bacterium]
MSERVGVLRRLHRGEEGAALVEFALIFPLQLMLTLTIIQFALVLYAHIVVYQAACLGARAAAVGDLMDDVGKSPQAAAHRVVARQVAVLTPVAPAGSFNGGQVPQGGALRWRANGGTYGYSDQRQQEVYALLRNVNVSRDSAAGGDGVFACDVEFDYVMIIPVGGQAIASFSNLVLQASQRNGDFATFPVHRVGFFIAPWLLPPGQ